MSDHLDHGSRPGRHVVARAGRPPRRVSVRRGRRPAHTRSDHGAVTAEYAVLLPTVVLVLVALVATAAVGVQQVRSQDAAGSAARILARGDGETAAAEAVRRMAGESTRLEHTEADGWVSVSVTHAGPGPLGWFDGVRLSAEASAPQQWPEDASDEAGGADGASAQGGNGAGA